MPFIALVPFAVLAFCVLGQMVLTRQARRILQRDHPETWRDLSGYFSPDRAVLRFALRGDEREFDDPALARIAKRLRTLQFVSLGALASYGVVLFAVMSLFRF